MDQLEFFHKVIRILGATGLRYMVVGSYASGFWGEPRATLDVGRCDRYRRSGFCRCWARYFLPMNSTSVRRRPARPSG